MSRRAAWAPAALALAVAGVAAYVLRYALRTTNYLNDEYGAVSAARLAADDPLWALTTDESWFDRGPERLGAFVMAVPDLLFAPTSNALRATHVILCVLYLLSAVPAYALLRGLGATRWPAAAFAALAIATPWALFGATLLNVTLAAPLTIAFCWAAWRAVVAPGLRWDVLVVVLAALNATARTSHAAFAVVAVAAALAGVWWRRPEGEPLLRSLRGLPARFARTHPVLAVAALAGIAIVAVVGPGRLVGGSYDHIARFRLPPLSAWLHEGGVATAQLTIATGFLAVLVGAPWLLREAARPREVRSGAFAVIALGVFVMYVFVAALAAPEPQERYVAPLAALPVIAFGAAVSRREAWPLGTLAVGALVARALVVHGAGPAPEALNFFFAPARIFFGQVVLGRLTTVLPFWAEHAATVAAVGALLVAAAVAAAWSPLLRDRRLLGVVPALLALAVTVPAGVYVLRKYEPATRPGDLDDLAWIDRAGDGAGAVVWSYTLWPEQEADRVYQARLSLLHNATACCTTFPQGLADALGPDGELPEYTRTPPRYVVSFPGFKPVVFAAEPPRGVHAVGTQWRVQRLVGRPRAAAVIEGAGRDGTLTRAGARIRLFSAARGCLAFPVSGPPGLTRPLTWSIAGRVAGRARAGETATVRLPAGADAISLRGPRLAVDEVTVRRC